MFQPIKFRSTVVCQWRKPSFILHDWFCICWNRWEQEILTIEILSESILTKGQAKAIDHLNIRIYKLETYIEVPLLGLEYVICYRGTAKWICFTGLRLADRLVIRIGELSMLEVPKPDKSVRLKISLLTNSDSRIVTFIIVS